MDTPLIAFCIETTEYEEEVEEVRGGVWWEVEDVVELGGGGYDDVGDVWLEHVTHFSWLVTKTTSSL